MSAIGHRTVTRVAMILEFVANRSEGVRLRDVAERLEAPKTSVRELVRGLVAVGYLVEQNGSYMLGPAIAALLWPDSPNTLVEQVKPDLRALKDRTSETAVLGIRVGDSIVYLDQVESSESIRYAGRLHERRPLFTTAMGKIIIADLPPRELHRLLSRNDVTDDRHALLAELEEIRDEEIAYNRGEATPGLAAAASGIRDGSGRVIAAVSVGGPDFRLLPRLDELGRQVLNTASRISKRIASNGPLAPPEEG